METTNLSVSQAPREVELERNILTTVINNSLAMADVRTFLEASDFYEKRNAAIFSAAAEVFDTQGTVDVLLTNKRLQEQGLSELTQTVFELSFNGSVITGNLVPYVGILRETAERRKMWETALKLMAEAADRSNPVENVRQKALQSLESNHREEEEGVITLAQTYEQLQERVLINQAEGVMTGTPTGFEELDRGKGMQPGDLIVVGAETSQGKTSFATALAVSAIEHGDGVAFYSMEMTPLQLTARIGAMKSGLQASDLMYRKVTMEQLNYMDAMMARLDKTKLYFDGRSNSSLESILLSLRRLKKQHDIKGAVVDYLQLLKTGERGLSPEQRAAICAREMKNIAKELGIWVIAISQLRRDQNSPEPTMARLRDSGQIEEAADDIYLIYRPRENRRYPEPFKDVDTRGTAMIKIEKGRNIGTGSFICGFDAATTRFYPLQNKPIFAAPSGNTDDEIPF